MAQLRTQAIFLTESPVGGGVYPDPEARPIREGDSGVLRERKREREREV